MSAAEPVVAVVVEAPKSVPVSAPMSRLATPTAILTRQSQPWSSSIFACYNDIGTCCWTMFCPALMFGTMANALNTRATAEAGSNAGCCAYFMRQLCCASASVSSKLRTRIREKYNLVETPCSDFVTHCFFSPCALCQEYRELKRNNVDLGRKAKPSANKKKSLRHQLLYKSVTRALKESTVAEDGSVVWLTTRPGGPLVKPPEAPSSSSGLRPSTS